MNKLTNFVSRLLIVMSLLFIVVFLDYKGKVDYDKVKDTLGKNINVLKIIKNINGKSTAMNVIKIEGLEDIAVIDELIRKEEIDGGTRYYPDEYQGVINEASGVIININSQEWEFCHSKISSDCILTPVKLMVAKRHRGKSKHVHPFGKNNTLSK